MSNMIKRHLFIVTTFFMLNSAYGQKYGNIWQFGNHAGIDFNSCEPVAINGSNSGFEGCSSISDSTGKLLFYTNSDTVWNTLNNVMPNGFLVSAPAGLSQVIIIPKPLSNSVYYIVTTMIQGQGSPKLQYHTVDMSLNGGLGDVTSKNNILTTSNVTEQIAATYHSNGIDIWLLAHEYGTNNFWSYLVTSSGVSSTPIVSSVGPSHISCPSNMNSRGEIKFSPNGDKIAFNGNGAGTDDNTNILAIFDFNNSTGIISNPINLPFGRGDFGLSFSPDNSKLYGATWKAFSFTTGDYNYLCQFDLSSENPTTIINSKQVIDSMLTKGGGTYGSIKIGPDGKVYVAIHNSNYLGVINSPNQVGLACNYVKNGFYLGGKTCKFGLNNYIEYKNYCSRTGIPKPDYVQNKVAIYPNPFVVSTTLQTANFFENASIFIYNSLGQTVKQVHNLSGQKIVFHRDNLPPGIYFLHVTQDGKTSSIDKLLITDN